MEFIEFGHNTVLVTMSFLVALVAGFTGLSLTKNLTPKSVMQRKISISLSALALGGGIWAMHFVAMLGLQMPILFYYDSAITLASALIAVLMVALALILLHFPRRTPQMIVLAGSIVGVGILAMHYVGMAGLQLCRAVYTPLGVTLTSLAAIGLCILAFYLAYSKRNNRHIFLGTLCFGAAVFAAHFLAMAGTNFVAIPQISEFGPSISNETLALVVIALSFVIFGAFLWVGSTYLEPLAGLSQAHIPEEAAPPKEETADLHVWIPCERDGAKITISSKDVAFVRADGHYTQVYTDDARYFCAWPITEAEKRLEGSGMVKLHRSYLGNPTKVQRFERSKDKGKLIFSSDLVPHAPVSRSHLKNVQTVLGAIRAI